MRVSQLIGLFLIGVVGSITHAATLYVASNGNDANTGTLAKPLRTMTRAFTLATAGTEIQVRAGTYNERLDLSKSGTANAYIKMTPYPNEAVILNGSNFSGSVITLYDSAYLEISGFEITNSSEFGIYAYNTHHMKFSNNKVYNHKQGAIRMEGSGSGTSHHHTVSNNIAYANGQVNNPAGSSKTGWPVILMADRSDNAEFSDNQVYQNYGEGVGARASRGLIIRGNTVHDNYSVEVYLDNAPGAIVDRNFIYNTGDTRFYAGSAPALGVSAAVENTAYRYLPVAFTGVVITNNIVVKSRGGFYYGNWEHGGGLRNSIIAHNTVVNPYGAALIIEADSASGNRVTNNIFYGGGIQGSVTGYAFDHNTWFNASPGSGAGAGDVLANPQFVGPITTLIPASFVLKTASPSASSPVRLANVAVDFYGSSRDATPSMGAIEQGATGGGSDLNLLVNSGFESGLSNWNDYGSNKIVSTPVKSGTKALKVGTNLGGVGQIVSVTAGSTYLLNVYSKYINSPRQACYVGIDYLNASGSVLSSRSAAVASNWTTPVSLTATAPAGTVSAQIWIWKDDATGYCVADDLSLKKQ